MNDDPYVVEGRYFPDTLQAFTFAQIQADRMDRPVEVHNNHGILWGLTWHATAYPEGYRQPRYVRAA